MWKGGRRDAKAAVVDVAVVVVLPPMVVISMSPSAPAKSIRIECCSRSVPCITVRQCIVRQVYVVIYRTDIYVARRTE